MRVFTDILQDWMNRITSAPVFLCLCILNTAPIWLLKQYLTLDGPSHLNNWIAANALLSGNSAFSECLAFNPLFVPNWISHLIAMPLLHFLSPLVVEKIIQSLLVVGIPWSVYRFISAFGGRRELAFLAFPFGYSMLFILGFYNFLFSVVFLFLAMAWMLRNTDATAWKRVIVMALWSLLLYVSHPLMLGILVAAIFLVAADRWFIAKKEFFVYALCAAIPVAWLLFFMVSFSHESNYSFVASTELWKWIKVGRPLINYGDFEQKYSQPIMLLVLFAFLGALCIHFWKWSYTPVRRPSFLLLLPLLPFGAYFVLPDGDGWAGYVSIRLLFVFCICTIAFAAWWTSDVRFSIVIILGVVWSYAGLLYERKGAARDLSSISNKVIEAAHVLPPGSTVLAVNSSDNWLLSHIGDLAAVASPVVCIDNHECGTGYFPLIYREESFPIKVGEERYFGYPNCATARDVDYILSFCDLNNSTRPFGAYLKSITDSLYRPVGQFDGVFIFVKSEH